MRFSIDLCLSSSLCAYQRCKQPSACEIVILLLRGLCYCSFILFFWAALQSCLPLGDVVVLVIATSPLFLVLSARLFLGEAIPRAWPVQMLLLGTGAALVNKPSFLGLAPPSARCPAWMAALPVGAAICGAFMNLASRRVKHLPPVTLLLANDAVAVVFACAVAFAQEGSGAPALLRPPLDGSTLLIALSAVLGFAGLMSNVYAYQTVSVTAIAAVASSSSVPFNYAFQVLFFADPVDGLACAGAALVMTTTIGAAIARFASKQEQAEAEKSESVGDLYYRVPDGTTSTQCEPSHKV